MFAIQGVIAVGTPALIDVNVNADFTPFNTIEAAPFLTQEQVTQLLQQYSDGSGIHLEAGIAEDVFVQTAGHPGLVCVCGRALEMAIRPANRVISMASWVKFRTFELQREALMWGPIREMSLSIHAMAAAQIKVLQIMLAAGEAPVDLGSRDEHVAFLAAQGWITSVGPFWKGVYCIAPLVRSIALAELSSTRVIDAPLPLEPHPRVRSHDYLPASL